jgi:hypothetical protein
MRIDEHEGGQWVVGDGVVRCYVPGYFHTTAY